MTLGLRVVLAPVRRPLTMRFTLIAVLCACACVVAGDGAHLRAKARLLSKLAGKHHKRGVFSSAPPFKLGHDIPHVTHSILKPIVVSYPPTASVTSVKVPIQHPLIQRYPVQVGHRVPVPHPHYGLKFPHHKVVVPKPDQHYHHHHHHIAPRPVVPVVPAHAVPALPATPIPQPSVTIANPISAPPPIISPILPAAAATPQLIYPQNHLHLKPLVPAAVPLQPASIAPTLYPYAPQFSYALRPGNAVQTSYFATYPRYPLVNYQSPVIPLAASAQAVNQVFLERPEAPHVHLQTQPHVHLEAQPHAHFDTQSHVHLDAQPHVHLDAQPHVHLDAQPHVHLDAQPHVHLQAQQPHVHVEQPAVGVEPTFLHATPAVPQHGVHLHPQPVDNAGWAPVHHDAAHHDLVPTQETHFTQDAGHQVFEHHTGEEQFHEYQHQLQHHIQQQIEQQAHDQQHQLTQEYGQPNVDYSQHHHDLSQQEYAQAAQQAHEYAQQAHEYAQHAQEYAQHHQEFAQQPGQEYGQPQPGGEYGPPQHQVLEGRSEETEEPQKFHNHIPLGLQPPIDRPLDHFQ